MLGQQMILKDSPQEIRNSDLYHHQALTVVSDSKAKRSSFSANVASWTRTVIFRIAVFIREDSARADRAENFLNEAKAKALNYRYRAY